MAERLKDRYGEDVPRRIAAMIAAVHPGFAARAFVRTALDGYAALDLMARGHQIARALRTHLPAEFPEAAAILVRSLGPALGGGGGGDGMAPFVYLPHVLYVAEHGLGHFDDAMRAQYELTQRFTAEFSIRAFIERHPAATLARLAEWTRDPSVHVRRLVSEGTRPRLPWARRLRDFQRDPRPVLELLELLKDDPELYVRRSVANNLNDIGKDHPELLFATARRWLEDADANRRWLVAHALRSAVKRGERGALEALGFGGTPAVAVRRVSITPRSARVGGSVAVAFDVANTGRRPTQVLVDFRVHFVKANGRSAPKTFKIRRVALAPGEAVRLARTVSLAPMTTRRHYPGRHVVDALINGRAVPLGAFRLSG
jgi:3-methyladenine DNA glycosylase AlkC/urease beta subunit